MRRVKLSPSRCDSSQSCRCVGDRLSEQCQQRGGCVHSSAGMHPLSRGSRRRRAAEGQGKGAKSRRAQRAPSGHGHGKDNTNPSSPCSYLLAFPGGAIPIGQEKVLCDSQADDTETPLVCSVKASGGLFEKQGAGIGGVGCVRLGTSRFFVPFTGRMGLAESRHWVCKSRPDWEDKRYCGGTRQAVPHGDSEERQIATGS